MTDDLWPFIRDAVPTKDHALLVRINRAVPKWIPEQMRQDVCQNVALAVVRGAPLTPQLVALLLEHERKQGPRFGEVSLDAFIGRTSRTWRDVLSEHNPRRKYRPSTEPKTRVAYRQSSYRQLSPDQIAAIRAMVASGRHAHARVAAAFNISEDAVREVSGSLNGVRGNRAVSAEPEISGQEGNQDSTGTFSSPTVLPRVEDGRNVPTASVETAESSREKSPGVTKTIRTVRTGFQPMPTVEKKQVAEFIAAFCDLYKQHRKVAYFVRRPKDLVLARMLLETYEAVDLKAMVADLLTVADDWIAGTDRGVGILAAKASWLAGRRADQQQAPRKYWAEECLELHGGTCLKRWDHEMRKRESA